MNNDLKVVTFERSPAYMHHRAMLNRRENNIVDALELMRRAVEKSPDNQEYRLDLAEMYCEMGCHEQSKRLLLDLLAEGNGPSECYYGLALNQMGMNDLQGARRLLDLYRLRDPEGARLEQVRQLSAEINFFSELGRQASRKMRRAADIANRACEAMKADEPEKACRLFERSLALASEQFEMRALYALSLLICGREEEARAQAERAAAGFPPSVRSLCVCAQVYALLAEEQTAAALVQRAIQERPEGQELRLLIYTLGELGMHKQVSEHVRAALRETPFDRNLLHIRAVALSMIGEPDSRVVRFWARILRIDPEDSIAQFYQQAALRGELRSYAIGYAYQVPRKEFIERLHRLVDQLGRGYDHLEELWERDAGFRQLVRWAVNSEDIRLSRAALTALSTIDHRDSRSLLRSLMFGGDMPEELRLHATMALRLQGVKVDSIMPADAGLDEGVMPDAQSMLCRLGVGERQLVRYADEVLRREYDVSAMSRLLLMWYAYRRLRGTHADPLRCVAGGAAALAYNYMLIYGPKPEIGALAKAFGCDVRQMVYYARCIARRIERIGEACHEDT